MIRILPVKLTDEELRAKADELAMKLMPLKKSEEASAKLSEG